MVVRWHDSPEVVLELPLPLLLVCRYCKMRAFFLMKVHVHVATLIFIAFITLIAGQGIDIPRPTTTPLRIFERPPQPLSNGSTYSNQHITSATNLLGTSAVSQEPGLAVYANTTFHSMCSSTDNACYGTCTAFALSCMNEHHSWSRSSLSHASSVALRMGNGTIMDSAIPHTHTISAETLSTFSISYLTSVYTTEVDWVDPNLSLFGWSTYTLKRPECRTSSCEKGAESTTRVSSSFQLHGLAHAPNRRQHL